MQNLLTSSLTNFQADVLFWLQLGVKNTRIGYEIDVETAEPVEDYGIEFSTIGFAMDADDVWYSYLRVPMDDGEGGEFIGDGDVLVIGYRSPQALVVQTLRELATYGLGFVFQAESDRLEDESELYNSCVSSMPPYGCGCWRCRHWRNWISIKKVSGKHRAECALCRNFDFSRYPNGGQPESEEIPY